MSTWADDFNDNDVYEEINYDDQEDASSPADNYADVEELWALADVVTEFEVDMDGNRFEVVKKVRKYHVDHPTTPADIRAKFATFGKGTANQSTLVSHEPPMALELGPVDQYERESRNEVKRMLHESSNATVEVKDKHLAIVEKREQTKKQEASAQRGTAAASSSGAGATWASNRTSTAPRDRDADVKRRVRVTNVADDITIDNLSTIFSVDGCEVEHVFLPRDKTTGNNKGFAFITFRDQSMAEKILKRQRVMFKNVVLQLAKAQ